MNEIISFYKKTGETPLQAVDRFRIENPEYANEKISYAGRLDPMAEGVLPLMIGEANKEREKYLGLDKEYTFEILFGVSTDTGDVLGLIQNPSASSLGISPWKGEEDNLGELLQSMVGKQKQKYPWYSSKTVNGKALFEYARERRQSEIERPSREIEIYSLALLETRTIYRKDLQKYIEDKINLVNGDFRQEEILETWKNFFNKKTVENFQVAKIKIKCSSGTYIRALVEKIGVELQIPALTLHIVRDSVDL